MLFLCGTSIPTSLARYFKERAAEDGHKVIFASMGSFASSEALSEIRGVERDDIKDQPVIVFQSIANVGQFSANDYFTQLLWAGDTLRRYGSGPLWAVTPFGPYARQDQERDGKLDSVACEAAAKHLALDYEGISTIELHSTKAEDLMKTHFGQDRVFNIDPTDLFIEDLKTLDLNNPVIVSPDAGANMRADILAKRLGADRFYVDKERSEIVNTKITGSKGHVLGCDAIMVDDMADTFGTAANSARLVHDKGAARVMFYSAHPVLSGPAWDRLAGIIDAGVIDRIRFCNTIARGADAKNFEQHYGPDIVDKIDFLDIKELIYRHIIDIIAQHPAMQGGASATRQTA